MLMKLLVLIIGVGVGFTFIYYNRWFVRTVGTNSWAEKTFGAAGTYTMYKLLGILVMVMTALYVFGDLQAVLKRVFGFLG